MPGWSAAPFVELNGEYWTEEFAAKHLGVSEELFRLLLRELEVTPAGVMRMSEFRRQGRQPRAYDAKKLIMISEDLIALKERLHDS